MGDESKAEGRDKAFVDSTIGVIPMDQYATMPLCTGCGLATPHVDSEKHQCDGCNEWQASHGTYRLDLKERLSDVLGDWETWLLNAKYPYLADLVGRLRFPLLETIE